MNMAKKKKTLTDTAVSIVHTVFKPISYAAIYTDQP